MNKDEIIGFEALYESMHKCKTGVSWKGSVAHYVLNGLEETYKLNKELESGKYKARGTIHFTITSPKPRDIVSISFRDRIYQRSMNDNVLYPVMSKQFTRDNWACQKGKGTDDARERMKYFLQRMHRKYGTDFYGLQCDIKGYYPNMRHDVTKAVFRRRLDDEIYNMTTCVLDEQYAGDVGYNPGSQMIQIAGISVLSNLDHTIKEQLRIKEAGRYMDDFLMFDKSKEYLSDCKVAVEGELSSIGMTFNQKKTKVFHISEGFVFLGFRYRITESGKVLMFICSQKVKDERRRLRKLAKKVKQGEMTRDKVDECYQAWRNHASKGNSWKLINRMDKFYKELWED